MSAKEANYLNMKAKNFTYLGQMESYSLVKLSPQLIKIRDMISLSSKELHVVKGYFDPFLHKNICADHLLCCIEKGYIETVFCNLRKEDWCWKSKLRFAHITGPWFGTQTVLHNLETKTPHGMFKSTVQAVIDILLKKSFSYDQKPMVFKCLETL